MPNKWLAAGLAAVLLAPPAVAAPAAWETYHNTRFGFTLRYPSAVFIPQPESDNGDGRSFVSKDGRAKLLVWGSYIPETFEEGWQSATTDRKPGVYRAKGPNWFVVSAREAKETRIVYERHVFVRDHWAVLRFEYPTSQKAAFDRWIPAIAKDFP